MIISRCLNKKEFHDFHKLYANERIAQPDDILKNWDYHFCFYDDITGELLGCIYIEDEDGKVMLSGFSKHKQMDKVVEAIKDISYFMRKDTLYSRTNKREAKLVLLKSGFKKIDDELFIRKAVI